MSDLLTELLTILNLVDVRGKNNIALMYRAIEIAEQLIRANEVKDDERQQTKDK